MSAEKKLLRARNVMFAGASTGLSIHIWATADEALCGEKGPARLRLPRPTFELVGCERCATAAQAEGYTHVADDLDPGNHLELDGFRPLRDTGSTKSGATD